MTGGTGSGLSVTPGSARTTTGGLTTVDIYNAGGGYQVGDQITVQGGDNNAVFEVASITTSSPLYGNEEIRTQNNYLVLPESVIGVSRMLRVKHAAGRSWVVSLLFNPILLGVSVVMVRLLVNTLT